MKARTRYLIPLGIVGVLVAMKPGMFANVSLLVDVHPEAITVPTP
jgi:hypothetical protein